MAQTHVPKKGTSMAEPYAPPPQFKIIDAPPLVQDISSQNTEFWLVRIQDGQLGPDDLKEKRIKLNLKTPTDKLGSFESSKGTQLEILDLQRVGGVQPVVFVPNSNGTLPAVSKISRQIAIVRGFDPIDLGDPLKEDDRRISPLAHESIAVSASIGGFSTVESLQENEERISSEILKKYGKKTQKGDPQVPSSSPLNSFQKRFEVHVVEHEEGISNKTVSKSNKVENLQERISTENLEKSASEPVLSTLKQETEGKVMKEKLTKSSKNSKHEPASEHQLSSPWPLHKEPDIHRTESHERILTERKKSNKRSKPEQLTSFCESPLGPSQNEYEVEIKESLLSNKKSHKQKHRKSKID